MRAERMERMSVGESSHPQAASALATRTQTSTAAPAPGLEPACVDDVPTGTQLNMIASPEATLTRAGTGGPELFDETEPREKGYIHLSAGAGWIGWKR